MGLVRQLLSHGFLVAAIILALLAYIFRGDLFKDAEHQVEATNDHATQVEVTDDHAAEVEVTDDHATNGTAVVLTAEQAAEELESAIKTTDNSSHSVDQSAYRPDIEPAPVHLDVEEEIKKIAPPPADIQSEKLSALGATPQGTPASAMEGKAATEEAQEGVKQAGETITNSAVEQTETSIADTAETAQHTAQEMVTELPVAATESHSNFVDEATYGAETNIAPAKMPAQLPNANQAPQQMHAQRDAYGPVYGRPSVSQPQQSKTPNETEAQKALREAREAFWKGDIEASVEKYSALIATSGDNPDFYGELGNVYYANGKWTDAANMYYEAGSRLAEQKQYGPAMHMVSILRGLKSDKADALEKTVTEAAWPAAQEQ